MNFAETFVDDLLKVLHFGFDFFSGNTATPLFTVKISHLFAVVAFIGTIECQSTMHYVLFSPAEDNRSFLLQFPELPRSL